MNSEPGIFEDASESAAADEAALAEARADIEAGRVISHQAVERWLLSLGTPEELPPPEVGD